MGIYQVSPLRQLNGTLAFETANGSVLRIAFVYVIKVISGALCICISGNQACSLIVTMKSNACVDAFMRWGPLPLPGCVTSLRGSHKLRCTLWECFPYLSPQQCARASTRLLRLIDGWLGTDRIGFSKQVKQKRYRYRRSELVERGSFEPK